MFYRLIPILAVILTAGSIPQEQVPKEQKPPELFNLTHLDRYPILSKSAVTGFYEPGFSPDGNRLVVQGGPIDSRGPSAPYSLTVKHLDGTVEQVLTMYPPTDLQPIEHPMRDEQSSQRS